MPFTCPRCGRTSHNLNDLAQNYCGHCHVFIDDVRTAPWWVVWSFEHDAWWGPERWGYTPDLEQAGWYTHAEAARIVERANIVKVNEQALPLADARVSGPPTPNQAGQR